MKAGEYIDKVKADREQLRLENARLLEFAQRAKRAIGCCTIVGGEGTQMENEGFAQGLLYAVGEVSKNLRTMLGAPEKDFYLWLERQVDPNAEFVDGDGNKIEYPR